MVVHAWLSMSRLFFRSRHRQLFRLFCGLVRNDVCFSSADKFFFGMHGIINSKNHGNPAWRSNSSSGSQKAEKAVGLPAVSSPPSRYDGGREKKRRNRGQRRRNNNGQSYDTKNESTVRGRHDRSAFGNAGECRPLSEPIPFEQSFEKRDEVCIVGTNDLIWLFTLHFFFFFPAVAEEGIPERRSSTSQFSS